MKYSGSPDQPDMTVIARSLTGNETLSMYPIIDPQVTNSSGTTYKVYSGNYGSFVFDHWSDGNSDGVRTPTINKASTITAYYKTS